MPAFESLQQHRHGEQSAARRQSMSDQGAKPGIFGQFFHRYAFGTAIIKLSIMNFIANDKQHVWPQRQVAEPSASTRLTRQTGGWITFSVLLL